MEAFRPIAAALGAACLTLAGPATATAGPANGEPAITVTGVEGDYLRVIHKRIHEHWTKALTQMQQPPAGAKASRAAATPAAVAVPDHAQSVLLFSIRWDGTIAGINLIATSGSPVVDKNALAAVRAAAPFPVPPLDIFSDDGLAHFRWSLSRDHRLCSDGQLRRKDDPLDEALPRLFIQGRVKEALLRVSRQLGNGASGGDVLGVFAKAWLARPNTDPLAETISAAVLARRAGGTPGAEAGRQLDRLTAGLLRRDTVAHAAAALSDLKVDVCEAVRGRLLEGEIEAREVAVAAVRHAGVALVDGVPCTNSFTTIVGDRKLPARLRVAALEALAASPTDGTRRLLADAAKDADPALRGAAILAATRPGGGKAALYRLQPLLRDPAPEVRAAAAAGLVRAGGEAFLDPVIPVLKERHPRVAVALAPELARLNSERSAIILGNFLRIDDAEVRAAAVRALAARQDEPARALLAPVLEAAKSDNRAMAMLRTMAFAGADADQLLALSADPELAVSAFQALLRARRHKAASDLLIARFDRFTPAQLATMLGAWLEGPPADAAVSAASGREERPQVK